MGRQRKPKNLDEFKKHLRISIDVWYECVFRLVKLEELASRQGVLLAKATHTPPDGYHFQQIEDAELARAIQHEYSITYKDLVVQLYKLINSDEPQSIHYLRSYIDMNINTITTQHPQVNWEKYSIAVNYIDNAELIQNPKCVDYLREVRSQVAHSLTIHKEYGTLSIYDLHTLIDGEMGFFYITVGELFGFNEEVDMVLSKCRRRVKLLYRFSDIYEVVY